MAKRKNIKVVHKDRLPKQDGHEVFGYATPETKLIELHKGLRGKSEMRYHVHEGGHVAFPMMSENEIKRYTKLITDLLWSQGYRKVDNKIK